MKRGPYHRSPKDPEAERARVWAEAERLRQERPPEGDPRPDWPEREPVKTVVAEPEEVDERDLVEWWAEEFPVEWAPGSGIGTWRARRETLRWMLGRISVDRQRESVA